MTALREIGAREAKELVHRPGEIAFLDVREHGEYGEGHPFLVVSCPYSRLEILAPAIVPRKTVLVLLIDSGDGVAKRAAGRLADLGYTDIAVVAGGTPAWEQAGFNLFKGVNVPTKTLGELAEHAWHVETIGPQDLAQWQSEGRPHRLFDARPAAEHRKMALPGAECLPNGELLHRLAAVANDPEVPIIVACAGRTRGLIGAAGLKRAGIPNPVFALENGTQGWALAGFQLLHGRQAAPFPSLDEAAVEASRTRALSLAQAEGIPWLDAATVSALAADPGRTLYVLDVRTAEEFAAGSPEGAVHAVGGQLVQSTDQWIGVRRARVVLADDTGLRATLAALWLRAVGYEVYVFPEADRVAADWQLGRASEPANLWQVALPTVWAPDALDRVAQGAVLLDLRPSMDYRAGHLAGARWAIRPRLAAAGIAPGASVLLAGEKSVAELAARDLREVGVSDIALVEGGPAEWRAVGLPVEATPDRPSDPEAIDFLFFVHDRHDGNLESARNYLAWETGLIDQLDTAERAEFSL
jgi:rhodanese-related sulfurtransferase